MKLPFVKKSTYDFLKEDLEDANATLLRVRKKMHRQNAEMQGLYGKVAGLKAELTKYKRVRGENGQFVKKA